MAARDIITEGLVSRVGDGWYIVVSTHKWLPHKPVFLGVNRPSLHVSDLPHKPVFLGENRPSLHVSDLIDATTMHWDRENVFVLFAY